MNIRHQNIRVAGMVQGVSFRFHTQRRANAIGLSGFVRNKSDGSVYIEVEGPEADLADFVSWCHEGPSLAQVTTIEVTDGPVVNFHDFRITG